jgi:hypothetical protein
MGLRALVRVLEVMQGHLRNIPEDMVWGSREEK